MYSNRTTDYMDTVTEDGSLKIVRTTVLVFLLLISLIGNSLLVFAIAVSSKRSSHPFNAYLLSMAAFGLLECSLSMPFATGFSLEGSWMFGDFWKGFNACFVQLQNIGVLLTVTAMTIDRYLAAGGLQKYKKEFSVHRANYIVLYTWIHAFIISFPLLFHNENLGLQVREYLERCLCGLSEGTTMIYTILLIGTSYGIPVFITTLFFVVVFVKSSNERKSVKSANTANYASYCLQGSQIAMEAQRGRYVLLLFGLFVIFKVPYISTDLLTQLGVEGAFVALNISTNETSTSEQRHIEDRFYYQTALTWIMFCFSAMFPLVTFSWFAEHKRRVRIHLCCGDDQILQNERNSGNAGNGCHKTANHSSRAKNRTYNKIRANNTKYNLNKKSMMAKRVGKGKGPPSVSSGATMRDRRANASKPANDGKTFHVPVLYAAADGLHLLASNKSTVRNKPVSKSGKVAEDSATGSDSSSRVLEPLPGEERNGFASTSPLPSSPPQKMTKTFLTLNPGELLKLFRKTDCGQPIPTVVDEKQKRAVSDEIAFERQSSVVDQRVDVLGSIDCLQSEEASYLHNAGFDFEDDTDSELNESANSRTLILPDRRNATAPAKKIKRGRTSTISPLPPQKTTNRFFVASQISSGNQDQAGRGTSRSMPDLFQQSQVSMRVKINPSTVKTNDVLSDNFEPNSFITDRCDMNSSVCSIRSFDTARVNSHVPDTPGAYNTQSRLKLSTGNIFIPNKGSDECLGGQAVEPKDSELEKDNDTMSVAGLNMPSDHTCHKHELRFDQSSRLSTASEFPSHSIPHQCPVRPQSSFTEPKSVTHANLPPMAIRPTKT